LTVIEKMTNYLLFLLKSSWRFSKKAMIVIATYTLIFTLFFIFTKKNPYSTNPNQAPQRTPTETILSSDKNNPNNKLSQLYKASFCLLSGDYCPGPGTQEDHLKHSVAGFVTNVILLPYTHPPASFTYWALNGLRHAGFVPKTYAAGTGFASIRSLIPIWSAFRNVSYIILVIILVAIGFMIMFRMKLNPQTVIGIENSLPRIVITLLLITLSFAIAGLLIDLMYIVTAIIVYIFARVNGLDTASTIAGYLQAGPLAIIDKTMGGNNFFKGLWNVFSLSDKMFRLVGTTVSWAIRVPLILAVSAFGVLPFLSKLIAKPVEKAVPEAGVDLGVSAIIKAGGKLNTGILKGLSHITSVVPLSILALAITTLGIPLLLGFIFGLTVLFIFFRILFLVLSSYIKILLLIIFSPLFLLANAIPGRDAFSSWLKNLMTELLTFPLLVGIFMVGYTITNITGVGGEPLFRPPFMFGIEVDVLTALIGMAILFMTPDLLAIAKKLLIPKPMPLPEFGPGVFFSSLGATGKGAQGALGFASTASYIGFIGKFLSDKGLHFPGSPRQR